MPLPTSTPSHSSPGAKPHAEVGDRVTPEDTVGVFEVMKLFSTLKAEINGVVLRGLTRSEVNELRRMLKLIQSKFSHNKRGSKADAA